MTVLKNHRVSEALQGPLLGGLWHAGSVRWQTCLSEKPASSSYHRVKLFVSTCRKSFFSIVNSEVNSKFPKMSCQVIYLFPTTVEQLLFNQQHFRNSWQRPPLTARSRTVWGTCVACAVGNQFSYCWVLTQHKNISCNMLRRRPTCCVNAENWLLLGRIELVSVLPFSIYLGLGRSQHLSKQGFLGEAHNTPRAIGHAPIRPKDPRSSAKRTNVMLWFSLNQVLITAGLQTRKVGWIFAQSELTNWISVSNEAVRLN